MVATLEYKRADPVEAQTYASPLSCTYSDTLVTVKVHTPEPSEAHKNQYVFCANNPVNFRDPDGLATVWVNGKKFRADTTDQFEYAMVSGASGNGTITSFRYRGHGDMGALWLSKKGTVNDGLMFSYMQKYGQLFSKTAKFYLEGCNTLNESRKGQRVADEIRSALPDAEIWGFTGLSRPPLFGGQYVPAPNNWFWGMWYDSDTGIPRVSEWKKLE